MELKGQDFKKVSTSLLEKTKKKFKGSKRILKHNYEQKSCLFVYFLKIAVFYLLMTINLTKSTNRNGLKNKLKKVKYHFLIESFKSALEIN